MRLIHTNDQLYSLLPNIMTIVKGERPVIDKIVPYLSTLPRNVGAARAEHQTRLNVMPSRDNIAFNEMAHRQFLPKGNL